MGKRFLVLLNSAAGTLEKSQSGDEAEQVRQGFAGAGIDADVRVLGGDELANAVRQGLASGVEAIIAGGGDGTLNTVANLIAKSDKAFGVLPLGTHNHFAKDLGLPLKLDEAIAALAHGTVEELPVGEVNGQLFLNFSALGFHPEVVRHRDAQRRALGRSKWAAMAVAMWRVFVRFPVMRVYLTSPGMPRVARNTPSVIVCNNPHQMKVFGVENASVPDRGLLNVYVARRTRRWGMLWLFVRALFGSLDRERSFEAIALAEVTIDTRSRHVRLSIDGEVTDQRPPLRYRVRPGGLRVIRPVAPAPGP